MKTIWKYEIDFDMSEIAVPAGAEPLHVGVLGERIYVWLMVSSEAPLAPLPVQIVGTGWPIDGEVEKMDYLGTVTMPNVLGLLVWHVFVGKN